MMLRSHGYKCTIVRATCPGFSTCMHARMGLTALMTMQDLR